MPHSGYCEVNYMGSYENYLAHHGVKGQKWGIRRYQNEDGSLTTEGRARYLNPDGTLNEVGKRELSKNNSSIKLNMEKQGMYKHMKNGREAKAYLRDLEAIYKKSAKESNDKEYKKDIESISKEYRALAKKYGNKKLSDIDKVELHRTEQIINQKAADAVTRAFRRNI